MTLTDILILYLYYVLYLFRRAQLKWTHERKTRRARSAYLPDPDKQKFLWFYFSITPSLF